MSTWVLLFAILLVGLLLMTLLAHAQEFTAPAPCGQSLACQRQRFLDLHDYAEFLADQLALAKSIVTELRQQLIQGDAALRACRAPEKRQE